MRALGLFVLSLALGCTSPATQLVVVVGSDYTPGTELTRVRIETVDASGAVVEVREVDVGATATPGRVTIPFSFGLVPLGGDPDRVVRLRASAFVSGEPTARVLVQAITRFVRGETRLLPLFLARSCEATSCRADETCAAGTCVAATIDPTTLPQVRPGEELRDAGGAIDARAIDAAGVDAPVPDGGGTDGGGMDGGPPFDAGPFDGGGTDPVDAGPGDAGSMPDGGPSTCFYGAPCDDPIGIWAGSRHTCVARRSGRVTCWGTLETIVTGPTPVDIAGFGAANAARDGHGALRSSCVLTSTGVSCFGNGNGVGALGSATDASAAASAVAGLGDARVVRTNGRTACARTATGMACWGAFDLGPFTTLLGTAGTGTCAGATPCALAAVTLPSFGAMGSVGIGGDHGCASLPSSDVVQCFGDNTFGQLGDGTTTSANPATIPEITLEGYAMTGRTTCALGASGTVTCWGSNRAGLLGIGMTTGPETCTGVDGACSRSPRSHTSSGWAAVEAVADGRILCARTSSSGTVACWGEDVGLGDGVTTHASCPTSAGAVDCSPSPVMATGITGAIDLAVGEAHACALLATGEVRCWGSNANSQLGATGTTRSNVPLSLPDLTP